MTPRPEVRHYVRNQSSRNGSKPQLIVLHDTEGANLPGIRDLVGLGNYFDISSVQASCHAANDAEGNDARYVPDSRKAWHVAGYNSVALGLEQIGFASQKVWPEAQLKNTVEWIIYWSRLHNIPIQRGRVANGEVIKPGVVMHSELGAIGGGHHDPGANYPIDRVITMALAAVGSTPRLAPARNAHLDARKQKVWRAHLATNRARLKALLAFRARLRQNALENSLIYAATGKQLSAFRVAIQGLTRLINK